MSASDQGLVERLRVALQAAQLQLEYLESRWPTGTTPPTIAKIEAALRESLSPPAQSVEPSFQDRVLPWMLECFGPEIAADKIERNHRFLEEALELVQANGCTQDEAHQLVDYVYTRDEGEINQEVGGVMVTLAALCLASGEDMHAAGETELARISDPATMNKIRAKQAAKPKHSPLPALQSPSLIRETIEADQFPLGTPVRCVIENIEALSQADWRDWTGFVARVAYCPENRVNYTVSDEWPPKILTDGFAPNQLRSLSIEHRRDK